MFENNIKLCSLAGAFLVAQAMVSIASAEHLLDVWSSLSVADATQLGRMNRYSPASDWSSNKVFSGVMGTTSSYRFKTFTVPAALIGSRRFIQISCDDTNAAVFVSAYDGAYIPPASSTNYLGDVAASGNAFGNLRFFQVVVPSGHDLMLVVNEVNPAGGIGKPFRLLVEGFVDTHYNDTFAPRFVAIKPSGADLVINGANGFTGTTYQVLMSTNVTLPLSAWTVIGNNVLGRNGNYSFTLTNEISPAQPQRFYKVRSTSTP